MPTFNTPERYLRAALDSVLAQIYAEWQLCIADDGSTESHVGRVLREYAAMDPRIRVVYRPVNGHISVASNSALSIATGDFIALLDHDDLLSPDALLMNALTINARPGVDMMYSDEDKIGDDGRRTSPFFKPDWSPESFLGRMYTCHLGVYRTALVREIGGFRETFEGSQDYDLVLRLTECTEAIEHIPRILYHWRKHPGSTTTAMANKPYARDAAVRALTQALARRGEPALAIATEGAPGTYTVRFNISRLEKVSVIVVARHAAIAGRCVQSLLDCTSYPHFEVIVLDVSARAGGLQKVLDSPSVSCAKHVRLARCSAVLNASQLHNVGASMAAGTFLVFYAAELQCTDADWMTALVEQVQRKPVGAAGAKILYHDGRLYHAGLVLGVGGIAGHSHHFAPGDTRGYFDQVGSVSNVSAVSPACLMIRSELYARIGGFDEALDPEFNAVDLCLRLRAHGYRIVYSPHACLTLQELGLVADEMQRARDDISQRALMEQRWQISRCPDPYYNPNLTLLREDYTFGP